MLGFRRNPAPPAPERASRIAELAAAMSPPPRRAQRRFDAAVVDRLTASWLTSAATLDHDLRSGLERIRARSRDLFQNNEYAAKFGRMVRNNVVGASGFTLQMRIVDPNGQPDSLANSAVEAAFWRWARQGSCEITGKFSFVELCRAEIHGCSRDGEILLRHVRGRGEFGYQLQALDPARIDTTLNRDRVGGENAIRMGVEVDEFDAPVAYHLLTASSLSGSYGGQRERVPASEILHRFIPMSVEQSRGVPWLHAAMRRLNDLNGYREAAIIAARVGASKMGIWETPDGGPPPNDGAEEGGTGNYITDASPGHFDYAPPGYKLAKFDPTYPHDQFDAFCKATLRGIASGIGVAYHGLANDLEGVNFSSIRAGVLEEREEWMAIQDWFIGAVLEPVFDNWIEAALLRGAIRLPSGAELPPTKLDKFRAHAWQGRRWSWVDPLKDINASVIAINNGLTSPQQVCAQSGLDLEDVYDALAAAEALRKAKGITLGAAPVAAAPAKTDDEDDDTD